MLKSFCIKTNNDKIVDYLLKEFSNMELDNLYISKCKFKFYNNIIVHYKGKNLNSFYEYFYNILSSAIIIYYEKHIIKHLISTNYFYFSTSEQNDIFNIVNNYLFNDDLDDINFRQNSIKISCFDYFSNNKSVILDGFVSFRINDYIKILDYVVDLSVNKFIIDREYNEFVDLLRCYINSKPSETSIVHLIYNNKESTLLDEFKNVINLDNCILNNKYLSDISFSSNDYTLNSLLTLLPEKIHIHIIDNCEDEFINTLKLIFKERICICTDCNICKLYNLEKIKT